MKKTGAVERRGSRHRLHYEVLCDECKRTKWVQADRLPAHCAYCAGSKGRRPDGTEEDNRTGSWYVRMVGSAHTLPQWAAGPPDAPCWTGGERVQFVANEPRDVPPEGAKSFDTRLGALCWVEVRKSHLAELGRPVGQYAVVQW